MPAETHPARTGAGFSESEPGRSPGITHERPGRKASGNRRSGPVEPLGNTTTDGAMSVAGVADRLVVTLGRRHP